MTRARHRSIGGERLLLTHRNTAHLLERARIYAEGGRLLYTVADGGVEQSFSMPHANIALLLLGQGTSMSSEAARLLAEEGVGVAFTGSGGMPLHYGSLTTYQQTDALHRMTAVALDPELSLEAGKILLRSRVSEMRRTGLALANDTLTRPPEDDITTACRAFESRIDTAGNHNLMACEAAFAKEVCKAYATVIDLPFRRDAGGAKSGSGNIGKARPAQSRAATRNAEINARIDQGNYLAYGVAGTVLWTLGVPASLSVLHGKTRAGGLVFDLADSFKDAFVLPIAFAEADNGTAFRSRLVGAFHDKAALQRTFSVMKDILSLAPEELTKKSTAL